MLKLSFGRRPGILMISDMDAGSLEHLFLIYSRRPAIARTTLKIHPQPGPLPCGARLRVMPPFRRVTRRHAVLRPGPRSPAMQHCMECWRGLATGRRGARSSELMAPSGFPKKWLYDDCYDNEQVALKRPRTAGRGLLTRLGCL